MEDNCKNAKYKKLVLENHRARKAQIYMKASRHSAESSLFKSWSPGVGRGHNRRKKLYVC
jgi:hypothetical protein